MQPFLRAPALCRKAWRSERAREPGLTSRLDRCEDVFVRQHRVCRDASAVHPLLNLRFRHCAGLLRQQVGTEVVEELLGVDALEGEVVEIAAKKPLHLVAAETVGQKLEEE